MKMVNSKEKVNKSDDIYDDMYRQILNLIFKDGSLTEKDTEKLNELAGTFVDRDRWHVPYELITDRVYKLPNVINVERPIMEKLDNLESSSNNKRVIQLKDDTKRHINLSIVQKKYIDKNILEANKELDEINGIKSSIYTDFIAILGIFTAITFAIFGGLQLLGNVFGKIGKFSEHDIGGVMMLASIYLLGVYVILIGLIVGIAKLQNRDYQVSRVMMINSFLVFLVLFIFGDILMMGYNGWRVWITIILIAITIIYVISKFGLVSRVRDWLNTIEN